MHPCSSDCAWLWLETHRAHLTDGTVYDYRLLIKKQIAGAALGKMTIDQISRRDIDNWILQLQESGTGPRRVNMALARLRTILRMAEEDGASSRKIRCAWYAASANLGPRLTRLTQPKLRRWCALPGRD